MKPNTIFATIILVTAIVGWDIQHSPKQTVMAQEAPKIDETTHITSSVVTIGLPTIPEDIKGYIHYRFGDNADKALLVLQGNGPGSCAENRNLDPTQDNNNMTWGGYGIDRGYWQINSYFHPKISEWCTRDVKCSTDYAYKLSKGGTNFSAWTCGRVYGI
jgi:hypothetical protein